MKKYARSNIIFTVSFAVLFLPLCFLIVNHLQGYGGARTAAAKESLSSHQTARQPVNREFSGLGTSAGQVPVLMYHQIIPERKLKNHHFGKDGSLTDMVVTLEQFTEQMDVLKAGGYTTLSLEEFGGFLNSGKKIPEKSVLLTFDDGYKNVFEFAYPVLKDRGFHAVQFLITGLVTDEETDYNPSLLQYASIGELKKAADVFDYGSHTHNFHQKDEAGTAFLNASSPSDVKDDLEQAAAWIGSRQAFAAPYGEYNTGTLEILRSMGVELSFTLTPGYAVPGRNSLEIPREGIYPSYTLNDFNYILERKDGGPQNNSSDRK